MSSIVLKSKKSFKGKGSGFHEHPHEHSINALAGWDKIYKEQYGKPLSLKDAKLIHGSRTTKAQAIDNSKRANSILKPNTFRANRYIKNPNRHDIQGVDTISAKEETQIGEDLTKMTNKEIEQNITTLSKKSLKELDDEQISTERQYKHAYYQKNEKEMDNLMIKHDMLSTAILVKESKSKPSAWVYHIKETIKRVKTTKRPFRKTIQFTKPEKKEKEYIKGGYADNQPYSKYDKKQLDMGTKVEMEHTNDPKIAKEIASDHLEEIPDYYDRLEQMEKEAEQPKTRTTYKVKIEDWEFYYDHESLANKEAKRLEKAYNSKAKIIKTHSPTYQLGDTWRDDFDYEGMLKAGVNVRSYWSKSKLNKLYDSYEDVNYHTPNKHLYEAINAKNKKEKERHLGFFILASQSKLNELTKEDISPRQMDFVAEGTHSKREIEGIFREEAKKIWKNDQLINEIDFDVNFYENGKLHLARISRKASAGKPSAIDDTLIRSPKHQTIHVNKQAMKLNENDFRKLMQHEALHLGYPGHTKEFRQIAKEKDIIVSENQLFTQEVHIQAKTKDERYFKTLKTVDSEDKAIDWLKTNRKDLIKKGYVRTRLQI